MLSATLFGNSVNRNQGCMPLFISPVHLNIKLQNQKMKKHIFWMITGCGLPQLLIFFEQLL